MLILTWFFFNQWLIKEILKNYAFQNAFNKFDMTATFPYISIFSIREYIPESKASETP